ncbi:hypothetical protein COCSUDRAFT_64025 [Coccomyxa subellipsoidea C-169]|uniref:Uncharacterized protein n=1 Tax=Coccomyxa subellipsoidea (strain C-169) TaxID=574566 RepID=I0YWY6_COCSC|nr:hypothetical protein COCSUDRAFT_64025 [Coccomyxa subellipsoidea C-169]EIE22905.1 hypothetical protein COCSUDRAFT_64025 [Coccomyxa subellipsoidea C-169]|eukprot:XP_005647449.1 hypothetical protein COCSUDRAFT_64025 [Coccomyxa subellipsoidea C-169]
MGEFKRSTCAGAVVLAVLVFSQNGLAAGTLEENKENADSDEGSDILSPAFLVDGCGGSSGFWRYVPSNGCGCSIDAESPTDNAGDGISEYLPFIFPLRKYGGTEDLEDNFMKSEFAQVALALRAQITSATDGIWCLTSQRAAESWAFSLYNEIHESSDPAAGAVKVLGFVLWIKNSPGRILCSELRKLGGSQAKPMYRIALSFCPGSCQRGSAY